MNFDRIAKTATLAAALAVASGSALAAEDGKMGASSTGKSVVSMSVGDRVKISGLDDIALGAFSGAGDMVGSSAFCVYRNGTGLYNMTVTSANQDGDGNFRATDGTNFVSYGVSYDVDADASDGTEISSGETRTGLAGEARSPSCSATDNAAIQVSFAEEELLGAVAGAYTDTLTLLVEPN